MRLRLRPWADAQDIDHTHCTGPFRGKLDVDQFQQRFCVIKVRITVCLYQDSDTGELMVQHKDASVNMMYCICRLAHRGLYSAREGLVAGGVNFGRNTVRVAVSPLSETERRS